MPDKTHADNEVGVGVAAAAFMSGLFTLLAIAVVIAHLQQQFPPLAILFWAVFYGFAAWRIYNNSIFWAILVWIAYFAMLISTWFLPEPRVGVNWVRSVGILCFLGLSRAAWRGIEGCLEMRDLKKQALAGTGLR
jgi:hypothetical protein